MAILSGVNVVGTAAVHIDSASVNPIRLHVHNNDNSTGVYLGGSAVTVATGYLLLKEESLEFILNPGETLYAVSSKQNHTISWLRQTM
jgi:hypothetical protein